MLGSRCGAANAEQNLKRIQELQKDKIASTSDLEQAVAESAKAQADVKAVEATDAIARLNLERSRVRAPFAGEILYVVATPPVSKGEPLGFVAQVAAAEPTR